MCCQGCLHIGDEALYNLARYCPGLETVNLQGCRHLSDEGLVALLEGCPNIRYLCISSCSQLTDQSLVSLATNCPQLSKCSFSTDRVRLNTSSLVLFSYGDTILADLPPKYLLKPKWGLFLSQPTKRHAGRIWNQFLPMFDVLISYFPNSDIQMYEGKFSKKKGHNFGFIKLLPPNFILFDAK